MREEGGGTGGSSMDAAIAIHEAALACPKGADVARGECNDIALGTSERGFRDAVQTNATVCRQQQGRIIP